MLECKEESVLDLEFNPQELEELMGIGKRSPAAAKNGKTVKSLPRQEETHQDIKLVTHCVSLHTHIAGKQLESS
jgi:hypothetical protein